MRIWAAAAAILLCNWSAARGSLIVQVESPTVTAGQGGLADVFFQASGDNPLLAGYNVRVALSPSAAGVTLGTPQKTDVGPNPRPAVFPDTLSLATSTGSEIFAASDTAGGLTIVDSSGLARIPFSTTSLASGLYSLIIDISPIGTQLADDNADPILFSVVNGTLTVLPVPEPAGRTLGVTALLFLAAIARLRHFRFRRCQLLC